MKSIIVPIVLIFSVFVFQVNGYSQSSFNIPECESVILGGNSSIPEYVRFKPTANVSYENVTSWINKHFGLSDAISFQLLSRDSDKLGFVHYRLVEIADHKTIESSMYIVHTKDGKICSMNGHIVSAIDGPANVTIDENTALATALHYVGASSYMWESPSAEKILQETTRNPFATFYPKASLVYESEQGGLGYKNFHLAYKFDVYATKPLSRQYIFVDAVSGAILKTVNRIETSNAPASAVTGYSGTQNIMTDSVNGYYRLRESGRGNGIKTLNAQTSTNVFSAIDFTNASTTWNNVNTAMDQYATDAHLASEATYDFFYTNFNRNGLDNAGYALTAFVHYDVQYDNAFWDGYAMNYGDGFNRPFTSLEVGGHEISHGLTQYTADLNYQDESGALNESFSDCMGVSIRQFIMQASSVEYRIGNQLGGAFRSMSNPKLYAQPNTYLGRYWAAAGGPDNGGVHTNSGVQNYWFYLVAHGGAGTNDNGQSYNISGIGIDKAAAIAFRNLTVYLTPSSQYADARTYSIQSATDLYGACSNEVKIVTDAWYAVGIGDSSGAVASFTQDATTACSTPASFHFTSTSNDASNYTWNFGDNTPTTNAPSPTHSYTSYGDYTVKLVVSNTCTLDSIVKVQLIHVTNMEPVVQGATICQGQTGLLTTTSSSPLDWYSSATGGTPIYSGYSFTTPSLNSTQTYYAQTNIPGNYQSNGVFLNNSGNGSYFTNSTFHYLIFNCLERQTLLSVDVDAQGTGNRTIVLQDNTGNTLRSVTVNIPDGQSTVTLNIPIPVGFGLRLGISGYVNLYRNTSGSYYPSPTTDSTIIITNSDIGLAVYNYFYNWQTQNEPCISNRVPVQVVVLNNSGSFSAHSTGTTVAFSSNAVGTGVSYQWSFGDGNSSTLQNPSHTYAGYGSYRVKLIESNGSCSDTLIQTITVSVNGIAELNNSVAIKVFPNPVKDELHVSIDVQENSTSIVSIINELGQTLISKEASLTSGENNFVVDVASFAAGNYFLRVSNDKGTGTASFLKTK